MIRFSKLPKEREVIEGSPFSVNINEKSKIKVRRIQIFSLVLYLIEHTQTDVITWQIDILFTILFILGYTFALDNTVSITGDHGDWKIIQIKNNSYFAIIIDIIKVEDLSFEYRITSRKRDGIALIIIKNNLDEKLLYIKTTNFQAKELQNKIEVINLPLSIRKRGVSDNLIIANEENK